MRFYCKMAHFLLRKSYRHNVDRINILPENANGIMKAVNKLGNSLTVTTLKNNISIMLSVFNDIL